jgi:transposase-like protein
MPRITYTEDFKREAVRLVTEDGLSRKQVARDLGVSLGALRDWIHRLRVLVATEQIWAL